MRTFIGARLIGLFLAAAHLASPAGLQAGRICPHHDGHGAAHPDAPHANHDLAAHDTESHHEHGHEAAAAVATSTQGDHEDAPCSCLDACSVTAVVVLAVVATALDGAAPPERVHAPAGDAGGERPRLTPYQLPWPNAPPVHPVG